jgi:hypothetical protein
VLFLSTAVLHNYITSSFLLLVMMALASLPGVFAIVSVSLSDPVVAGGRTFFWGLMCYNMLHRNLTFSDGSTHFEIARTADTPHRRSVGGLRVF